MPNKVTFAMIQAYLDAIADKANLSIDDSPHGPFWRVSHKEFVGGNLPVVKCQGKAIPLVDTKDPPNTAFRLILIKDFCNKGQMPAGGGPFITDPDYTATLADGTKVTGKKIQADIESWLRNGFPEK
jgi:hypothetical protein